jgi:hypothetical protein
MKGRQILVCVLALGLLLALAVGLSQAQGPEPPQGEVRPQGETGVTAIVGDVIPIQGRLTDADGNPVPDGDYTLTFRLYDVSSEGEALCEDTDGPPGNLLDPAVPVTNGLFTAYMNGCTADVINGRKLWLGIEVGSDGEMEPRQGIYPVPYAWSLRPGAVISDTYTYVQMNGTAPEFLANVGIHGKATGALGSIGVYGTVDGAGAGVLGKSSSGYGFGGYFENSGAGGVGLYARAGDGDTADIELGSNSDTGTGDNGWILSTDYQSSDLYLTSNDDVRVELDDNNDEDGEFRIDSSGIPVFRVEESGCVNLANNAGGATTINIGDHYRDNAIVAWAKLSGGDPGSIQAEFGISAVDHYNTGCYKIYLDISAAESASLIPMAIAEIDSAPVGAGAIRIVSVNQLETNIFNVYINDGNGNLVDNDFVFIVTAR